MVRLPAFCVPFLRIHVSSFGILHSEFRIFLQPRPRDFPRRFHRRGNRQRVHLVQRNKPIPLRRIRVGRVHLIQLHPPDLVRENVLRVPSGADVPQIHVHLRAEICRDCPHAPAASGTPTSRAASSPCAGASGLSRRKKSAARPNRTASADSSAAARANPLRRPRRTRRNAPGAGKRRSSACRGRRLPPPSPSALD